MARDSLDVEIDGIVAKVENLPARNRLGSTAKHPRWAIGVKFEARSATTRLDRIEVQVGRTGVLTPVGDVIPEVVGRIQPSHRGGAALRPPATCPSCGARVAERGAFRLCPNTVGCPAQRVRAIEHFASRDGFDIDGLGPSTVQLLVDHGLVHTVADLFIITDDDLRALPRFGAVGATRLATAIEQARRVDLARFLFALGIPDIGTATARRLAARFRTLGAIRRATRAQLAAIPEVGPAAARQIVEFFKRPNSRAVIDAMVGHGVTIVPYRERAAGALAGRSVVFTGALETMTRADAGRLVEQHGGRPMRTVTRATNLVVAGSAPGSRLDRASALGIHILSEREFLRRYRLRPEPQQRGSTP